MPLLGGSWDLVSAAINAVKQVSGNYKSSYHIYIYIYKTLVTMSHDPETQALKARGLPFGPFKGDAEAEDPVPLQKGSGFAEV